MIKAGFGSVDITPPLGCALQGYFRPRKSESIHDPLLANAMVIDDGKKRICLISCDLIGVTRKVVNETRKLLKERVSIPEDNVIICGTHTHTGPVMMKTELPGWENAMDERWLSILPYQICSSAIQAVSSLTSTKVAWIKGREENISFNRRYMMKDGTIKTNPERGHPDIVGPVGPIDPDVGIVAFGEEFTDIRGIAVNFALHLDNIGGNNISADLTDVLRKTVRKSLGKNTGVVYTSGAMGDINSMNFMKKPKERRYFDIAERTGRILGAEVIKAISRIDNFQQEAETGSARMQIKLPLKKYDDSSLEKARKNIFQSPGLHNLEYLSGLGILKAAQLGKEEVETEITALRIGEAAFVSIPGEYFVELGLHIKKNSPFPFTFITELGLDCLGYIAHRQAYEQQGYEPVSSPIACGGGEIIAEKAISLLESIR